MSNRSRAPAVEPESSIRDISLTSTSAQELHKPHLILKYTHESAEAFLKAFDSVRNQRGATRGATTDEEQDLLRAMLVMSAAGLDSMLKQLMRDCLEALIQSDDKVKDGFEEFVTRQIRGDPSEDQTFTGHRFLARILIADSQKDQLIEEYITRLTGVSLQSNAEVMRTANALGLDPRAMEIPQRALRQIFEIRNRIIHELDINFDAARRNRQSRTRDLMIAFSNVLLKLSEDILIAVDTKLYEAS